MGKEAYLQRTREKEKTKSHRILGKKIELEGPRKIQEIRFMKTIHATGTMRRGANGWTNEEFRASRGLHLQKIARIWLWTWKGKDGDMQMPCVPKKWTASLVSRAPESSDLTTSAKE